MQKAMIQADDHSVSVSGVDLSQHKQFTQQLFRTIFATYRHLVLPGEAIDGREWLGRILKHTTDPTVAKVSHTVICEVMR